MVVGLTVIVPSMVVRVAKAINGKRPVLVEAWVLPTASSPAPSKKVLTPKRSLVAAKNESWLSRHRKEEVYPTNKAKGDSHSVYYPCGAYTCSWRKGLEVWRWWLQPFIPRRVGAKQLKEEELARALKVSTNISWRSRLLGRRVVSSRTY